MNLDLLKKLTRLANNNPNENEANLAARKVSKMLQEGDWKLPSNGTGAPKSEPQIKVNHDPRTREMHIVVSDLDQVSNPRIIELLKALQHEITRPKTWNDVKRSEEPFWKSKPPYESYPKADVDFQKMYEEMLKEAQRRQREYDAKREQHQRNWDWESTFKTGRYRSGFDWWGKGQSEDFNPFYTDFGPKKSAADATNKPKKERECIRCHNVILTANINNIFICNKCQWGEYQQSKGEAYAEPTIKDDKI